MSFRVPSPAAAAKLQNNTTKFYFAILEGSLAERPEGTFRQAERMRDCSASVSKKVLSRNAPPPLFIRR